MCKNIKIYLLLILISFSVKIGLLAQTGESPFKVYIQTERLIFAAGNPIKFTLSIKNISNFPREIKVYSADYTTFQFIVFNKQGREADIIVPFRQRNQNVTDIANNSRAHSIIISPGETISREVDLSKYYNIKDTFTYKVRGFFMPDARVAHALKSENTIYFRVKADRAIIKEDPLISSNEGISPSEIIMLFLNAEKKQDNKNYIKYIKLKKYINSFSDFAVAYNNSDNVYRKKILRDFTKYLITPRNDYIVDFKVKKQIIYTNENKAEVNALVIRKGVRINFSYNYRYYLEKYRDYWLITNVNATISRERIDND